MQQLIARGQSNTGSKLQVVVDVIPIIEKFFRLKGAELETIELFTGYDTDGKKIFQPVFHKQGVKFL